MDPSRDEVIEIAALKFNEATQHWEFGEIDWAEFKRVLNGEGPCNRRRLARRVRAQEEGAWAREAARAHAEKRRARAAKPAE
jgi:ring-1,2-phenylacetyl-CoA epoxidase subunit PaaA